MISNCGIAIRLLIFLRHAESHLVFHVAKYQLAFYFLLAPVLAIFINKVWQKIPTDPSLPPVVSHWIPILGSAVAYGDNPIKFLLTAREKYGDVFTFVLFGKRMTAALGPRGNAFVTGGKTAYLSAEEAYAHLTTPIFGRDVVFDVPNEVFMEQKKFVKSGFSLENLRAYVGIIEEEVIGFLDNSSTFALFRHGTPSQWGSFHALNTMSELTILTACTVQGKDVRSSLDKSFVRRYEDLAGGFTPMHFLFPNLPFKSYRKRDKAQKEMSSFYTKLIRKRKASQTFEGEHDVIGALLQQRYKSGREVPEHEIAHLLIAFLITGQHTSATTATWALLHIAHEPSIANALYEEQLKYFSTDNKGEFRTMTYDEMRSLPWLDSVIRETLRLHTPVHTMIRKVKESVTAPQPLSPVEKDKVYIVPKGQFVLSSPAVSHVDPNIWHNPLEWNPSRWHDIEGFAEQVYLKYAGDAGEKADYGFGMISKGTSSPYQPFGAGRHRCIGEQFAYLQLGTIISTLVRKIEMRLETGIPEPNYRTMITTMKEPCDILYRRRCLNE